MGRSGFQDGPWCGVEQSADDTAYQAHTGPRVKVIYAYPSDRPNRFATMRDLIQSEARDSTDLLLGSAGPATSTSSASVFHARQRRTASLPPAAG